LDRDLAELYGVSTGALNQAVKRNSNRFPERFMFQLSEEEFKNWKSQIVISNLSEATVRMGLRKRPFVFTERGVFWLSRRMGFDILMALSGIDALGWGYRAKAVRTGPVAAKNHGKPLGPGSEVIRRKTRTPLGWHGWQSRFQTVATARAVG